MKIYGYELPDDVCEHAGMSLGHLGSKWAVPLIMKLEDGPLRANALRRSLPGVSQKVLTETLRILERNGYVARLVTPSVPRTSSSTKRQAFCIASIRVPSL
jgi:DNA-binding HxlR family transcriptional regulator